MAESDIIMARLTRLETAFIQVSEILADHSERFDRIDRRLESIDGRLEGIDRRFAALDTRLDGVNERLDGVTERLERLIRVTIEERTNHYERLRDVEKRLTRLEDHVGLELPPEP